MNPSCPPARHAASHPVRLAYVRLPPPVTQSLLGAVHFGASPAFPKGMIEVAAHTWVRVCPLWKTRAGIAGRAGFVHESNGKDGANQRCAWS
ncbi:MAG TPA: hypothetical protein VJ396_07510 [Acidiferrobacterales bacterium]|nr:hypothetical protein [Acidiferrobacterales bacterium]